MRAGIALGSNLGDRLAALARARQQISDLAQLEPPLLASSVYESEPVACEPDAPKFLNAVIEIGYRGTALHLLGELRRIEAAAGRPSVHARNRSRTLDLDLLYFGDAKTADAELELPHPRMQARRFVLEPLNEIRPALVLPTQTETSAALLAQLSETPPLVRMTSKW